MTGDEITMKYLANSTIRMNTLQPFKVKPNVTEVKATQITFYIYIYLHGRLKPMFENINSMKYASLLE